MATLMLINPQKRRKKQMAKRRTPAQLKSDRRLGRMAKARAKLKSNPAKPVKRKAAPKAAAPRKTLAKVKRTAPAQARYAKRRAANTVRNYYPNPARRKNMLKNAVDNQLRPALTQASGAIALDFLYGYVDDFIPVMLNTGMARHATKGVAAMALSFVASNFIKNTTANELAKGALTVTMHAAMTEGLQTFAPNINLGYFNPSPVYSPRAKSDRSGVGYFSNDQGSGMGYFSNDQGDGFSPHHQSAEIYDSSVI